MLHVSHVHLTQFIPLHLDFGSCDRVAIDLMVDSIWWSNRFESAPVFIDGTPGGSDTVRFQSLFKDVAKEKKWRNAQIWRAGLIYSFQFFFFLGGGGGCRRKQPPFGSGSIRKNPAGSSPFKWMNEWMAFNSRWEDLKQMDSCGSGELGDRATIPHCGLTQRVRPSFSRISPNPLLLFFPFLLLFFSFSWCISSFLLFRSPFRPLLHLIRRWIPSDRRWNHFKFALEWSAWQVGPLDGAHQRLYIPDVPIKRKRKCF